MSRPYREVAEVLRQRINRGEYSASTPLPSERDLVNEFEIHRATVRRALKLLSEEGLVSRKHGQRAFAEREIGGRDLSIGLYAADAMDPFGRSLIANGISERLARSNSAHHLIWSNYHRFELTTDQVGEEKADAFLVRLAALLLWPPRSVNLDLLMRARARLPVVLLDRRVPGFESDFVGFLDTKAGYEAAKHLYEVGHRRLAYIGDAAFETTVHRRFGLHKFCSDAGIEPYWEWAAMGSLWSLPEQIQRSWCELPKDSWPTAAVCANDETAARLISILGRFGRRVPEDLALIGFGGAQPDLLAAIGLTTMEQPYAEAGGAAAEIVLGRLSGGLTGSYRDVHLAMKLQVRTSCGTSSALARV